MIPACIKNCPLTVRLLPVYLLFLFLISSSAFAQVEIKNYFNPFKQIKAVYNSPDYGLFISNGSGVYILDTETGELTNVEFKNPSKKVAPDRIFQYGDEIFCYVAWGSTFFKYVDGKFSRLTEGIIQHCFSDSVLVLLRKNEPRVITYRNGNLTPHNLGDNKGSFNFAHLTEMNGKVYCVLHNNYSGNMYIFSAANDSLSMIVAPGMDNYNTVKNYFPAGITAGPDRIWFYSYKGYFYLEDNKPVSIEEEYGLDSLDRIVYNKRYIFGLRNNRMFCINMQTKEVEFLTDNIGEDKNTNEYKSDKAIYFHVYGTADSRLFKIDKANNDFSEIKLTSEATITQFQAYDDDMLMVRGDILEIYNGDGPPKVFGENGLITNSLFNLCKHPVSGDVVALTICDYQVYLSYFNSDTTYYEETPIKLENNNYSNMSTGLVISANGTVYVSVDDQLWIKDSNGWEQLNFWRYADDEILVRQAEYKVLARDSSDAVWIVALTQEQILDTSIVSWRSVYKLKGEDSQTIYEMPENEIVTFDNGICLANGDVIWATSFDKLHYFKNGEALEQSVDFVDCDDDPHINSNRRIFPRPDGSLVILYWPQSGYDTQTYSNYYLDAGVVVFNGGNWDSGAYSEYLTDFHFDPDYYATYLCDDDGNEFFVNKKQYAVVTKDKIVKTHEFDGLSQNGLYIKDVLTIGNTFWVSSDDQGLFRVTMPDPIDVREPESDEQNELCREVVSGNTVRLNFEVDTYQVYSAAGVVVAEGGSSRAVDVSQLNPGVYFIRARTMTGNYYGKFIRL